jgi:hypothetical protein
LLWGRISVLTIANRLPPWCRRSLQYETPTARASAVGRSGFSHVGAAHGQRDLAIAQCPQPSPHALIVPSCAVLLVERIHEPARKSVSAGFRCTSPDLRLFAAGCYFGVAAGAAAGSVVVAGFVFLVLDFVFGFFFGGVESAAGAGSVWAWAPDATRTPAGTAMAASASPNILRRETIDDLNFSIMSSSARCVQSNCAHSAVQIKHFVKVLQMTLLCALPLINLTRRLKLLAMGDDPTLAVASAPRSDQCRPVFLSGMPFRRSEMGSCCGMNVFATAHAGYAGGDQSAARRCLSCDSKPGL